MKANESSVQEPKDLTKNYVHTIYRKELQGEKMGEDNGSYGD